MGHRALSLFNSDFKARMKQAKHCSRKSWEIALMYSHAMSDYLALWHRRAVRLNHVGLEGLDLNQGRNH